jgi:hypothetical protein
VKPETIRSTRKHKMDPQKSPSSQVERTIGVVMEERIGISCALLYGLFVRSVPLLRMAIPIKSSLVGEVYLKLSSPRFITLRILDPEEKSDRHSGVSIPINRPTLLPGCSLAQLSPREPRKFPAGRGYSI